MLFPGFARFGGGGVTGGPPPALETTPPAYFGKGATSGGPSGGGLTPTLPTGWQPGHYHICQVYTEMGIAASMSVEWEKLLEYDPGAGAPYFGRLTVFGKFAQVGDTTPTVTISAEDCQACVYGFSGVYVADPIDDADGASEFGVALSYPSLDCTGPNRMIVGFTAIDTCSGYANSNLASITERHDHSVSSGGMCMWTGTVASSGAIGVSTANGPNTDGIAIGILALRPA